MLTNMFFMFNNKGTQNKLREIELQVRAVEELLREKNTHLRAVQQETENLRTKSAHATQAANTLLWRARVKSSILVSLCWCTCNTLFSRKVKDKSCVLLLTQVWLEQRFLEVSWPTHGSLLWWEKKLLKNFNVLLLPWWPHLSEWHRTSAWPGTPKKCSLPPWWSGVLPPRGQPGNHYLLPACKHSTPWHTHLDEEGIVRLKVYW